MLDDLPSLSDLADWEWSFWLSLSPTVIQVFLIVKSYFEQRKLRRQLAEADAIIDSLRTERDEAMMALGEASSHVDAEVADNDALLDALSEIVDATSLPAAREIACNILDLPIYPELRRAG